MNNTSKNAAYLVENRFHPCGFSFTALNPIQVCTMCQENLTKPKIIYCLQIILLSFQTSFTEQIFKISLGLSDIFIFQNNRTITSDVHLETHATLARERTNWQCHQITTI